MKTLNEWSIKAPWGKIALVSWGNPSGEPVLLVHGGQDSVATFIPLLQVLPVQYYYVGFDIPGNGRSDNFPVGVNVPRFLFVTALDMVIKHLEWEQFAYVAHSMGCELGLFYNAIFPHRIKQLVLIEIYLKINQDYSMEDLYQSCYAKYYDNYKICTENNRVYSKTKALHAVMNARGLTEEQAEIIISRNLIKIGDDLYRLSWDPHLKLRAPLILSNDFFFKLFSTNCPPTLLIRANAGVIKIDEPGNEYTQKLIRAMKENSKVFDLKIVDGTHDVHFTNPERLAGYIRDFLEKDFSVKSKL